MKTSRAKNEYRQGDLLFLLVGSPEHKACTVAKGIPPVGARQRKRLTGHILEGEATGHIHRVRESDLRESEVLEIGEGLYLNVSAEGGISIDHEDHKTVTLPPGNYEVVRQREYSPEAIRNVAD